MKSIWFRNRDGLYGFSATETIAVKSIDETETDVGVPVGRL